MKSLCGVIAGSILGVVMFLQVTPGVSAYETAVVADAGTLTGRVILKGPIPEDRIFPLSLYPFGTFCKSNKRISDENGNVHVKEFEIDSGGGLKDVVISVQGVRKGKPFKRLVTNLIAKDCEFFPFVSIVQDYGTFVMKNEDPILHNSQLYQSEKGNVLLTVPNLPHSFGTYPIHFEKGKRIYQMICGMHEFMQTWGYAVDNPYYALTDSNGKFSIDQLPPGTYKVIAWRPHLKPVEQEITIPPNGNATLVLEFDSKEVKRPHYETQEKFRIQR